MSPLLLLAALLSASTPVAVAESGALDVAQRDKLRALALETVAQEGWLRPMHEEVPGPSLCPRVQLLSCWARRLSTAPDPPLLLLWLVGQPSGQTVEVVVGSLELSSLRPVLDSGGPPIEIERSVLARLQLQPAVLLTSTSSLAAAITSALKSISMGPRTSEVRTHEIQQAPLSPQESNWSARKVALIGTGVASAATLTLSIVAGATGPERTCLSGPCFRWARLGEMSTLDLEAPSGFAPGPLAVGFALAFITLLAGELLDHEPEWPWLIAGGAALLLGTSVAFIAEP